MLESASLGGVWSGGGCLLGGVSGPGGVCSGGAYIPACTEADTLSPPVDRQTPVKILPWPNFVAAGKNWYYNGFMMTVNVGFIFQY